MLLLYFISYLVPVSADTVLKMFVCFKTEYDYCWCDLGTVLHKHNGTFFTHFNVRKINLIIYKKNNVIIQVFYKMHRCPDF